MRGILWMVVTGLCFVGVSTIVKHLGGRVPAAEAAFLRYVLGLIFLIPMLRTMRAEGLSRESATWFGARGVVHSLGVITWFFAMGILPLAEVAALNYLSPVFITIGAALFLGERLALRRMAAILVALGGVMIILRPGFRDIQLAHLSMLATALMFAASYLIAKRMADRVSPTMVVGMLSITATIGLAPWAYAVWITPTLADLGWLFLVAGFATAGHFTMTLAFQAAPMTVTQPVTFLQLIWSVLVGLVIFHDPFDIFVVLGGSLILAAVVYITLREARGGRAAITPPVPAVKG